MGKISAGLMMVRRCDGNWQVLLVHPGGPFFAKKDAGAWTIPKGEPLPDEDLLEAAKREFHEETGVVPTGTFRSLSPIRQKGGKVVHAWAVEGDCEVTQVVSNTFLLEWPPKSGRQQSFPEIDRAEFFGMEEARRKINPAQVALLAEFEEIADAIG